MSQFEPLWLQLENNHEEKLDPVHLPIVFGNEIFLVSHQDTRHIKDVRISRLCKVGKFNSEVKCPVQLESCPPLPPYPADKEKPVVMKLDSDFVKKYWSTEKSPVEELPLLIELAKQREIFKKANNSQQSEKNFAFHYDRSTSTSDLPPLLMNKKSCESNLFKTVNIFSDKVDSAVNTSPSNFKMDQDILSIPSKNDEMCQILGRIFKSTVDQITTAVQQRQ